MTYYFGVNYPFKYLSFHLIHIQKNNQTIITDFYRVNGRNLSDLSYIIGSQWSISFEKIKVGSVLIVTMTVYVSERDGPKKEMGKCAISPPVPKCVSL